MWSSKKLCSLAFADVLVAVSLWSLPAKAQQQPAGFAVERFYQSAPGGGWFIMDDLDISGRLGGVVSFSSGYARNPLVITGPDGKQKLAVVSEEAFLDVGAAVTHNRFRGYINFSMPLLLSGTSGTLGPYQFTAPSVSFGNNPDTIADPRIGVDVRLLGEPGSVLRLGACAQLIIPSGSRANYVSDGEEDWGRRLGSGSKIGVRRNNHPTGDAHKPSAAWTCSRLLVHVNPTTLVNTSRLERSRCGGGRVRVRLSRHLRLPR